ncbi:hypothetical protein QZH41_002656 [Actinostola sp. cb2023]|nr:hypothetical protein QZH41_002656 [Actinostola sp. cb2023]
MWLPVPVLICYRAIFALYSITWIIYMLAAPSSSFRELKTLFFITNWGYFALVVYFVLAFTITTLHYIKRRQGREHTIIDNEDDEQDQVKHDETKCFHKVLWFFYNIASNMAIAVTMYYWALDYNGKGVTLSDLNVHILNSVFIILDHTLGSAPWRLFHVVYCILFALLYTIAIQYCTGYGSIKPRYTRSLITRRTQA